jgi:hypothetical protein
VFGSAQFGALGLRFAENMPYVNQPLDGATLPADLLDSFAELRCNRARKRCLIVAIRAGRFDPRQLSRNPHGTPRPGHANVSTSCRVSSARTLNRSMPRA